MLIPSFTASSARFFLAQDPPQELFEAVLSLLVSFWLSWFEFLFGSFVVLWLSVVLLIWFSCERVDHEFEEILDPALAAEGSPLLDQGKPQTSF